MKKGERIPLHFSGYLKGKGKKKRNFFFFLRKGTLLYYL